MKVAGRSIETHHLVALSAWASKGVTAVSQLVGIRLLLDALGAGQYAVFVVLASFAGWIQLMDFGVGNTLQNSISEERERGGEASRLIALLAILLPGLLLVFALAMVVLDLVAANSSVAFLAVATSAGRDVLVASCAALFATAIGGIAYKVWYAEQKGWWANLFPALASLCSLGLVFLAGRAGYRDFLGVVLLYQLPPAVLALSVLGWRLFGVRHFIRGALRAVAITPFLRRSLGFFAFALLSALTLQVDYFILAAHASAYEMVSYNIVSRLFAMVGILHAAYLGALWPVCTQLLVAGKGEDVQRLVFRAIQVGTVLVAGFFLVFFLGRDQVARLLAPGEPVALPALTISLMAGYFLIRVWCDSWAMVFLSAGRLTALWLMVPVQAAISIGLQLLLVRDHGVNGIITGLSVSFLATVVWLLPLLARSRILSRA